MPIYHLTCAWGTREGAKWDGPSDAVRGSEPKTLLRAENELPACWGWTLNGGAGRAVAVAWSAQRSSGPMFAAAPSPILEKHTVFSRSFHGNVKAASELDAVGVLLPPLLPTAHIYCHDFTFNEKPPPQKKTAAAGAPASCICCSDSFICLDIHKVRKDETRGRISLFDQL